MPSPRPTMASRCSVVSVPSDRPSTSRRASSSVRRPSGRSTRAWRHSSAGSLREVRTINAPGGGSAAMRPSSSAVDGSDHWRSSTSSSRGCAAASRRSHSSMSSICWCRSAGALISGRGNSSTGPIPRSGASSASTESSRLRRLSDSRRASSRAVLSSSWVSSSSRSIMRAAGQKTTRLWYAEQPVSRMPPPASSTRRRRSATRRDLPTPASPRTRNPGVATSGCSVTDAQAATSRARTSSRPTSGVRWKRAASRRDVGWRDTPTVKTSIGRAMPFSSCRPSDRRLEVGLDDVVGDVADDERAWRRDRLEAGGHVGRSADDRAALPHRARDRSWRPPPCRCGRRRGPGSSRCCCRATAGVARHEGETGQDGPPGVVLVRLGMPEAGHDPIALELDDLPAVALDGAVGHVAVGPVEIPHRLGLDGVGQRRGADEIGEQERDERPLAGELLLLARAGRRSAGRGRWSGRRRGRRARSRSPGPTRPPPLRSRPSPGAAGSGDPGAAGRCVSHRGHFGRVGDAHGQTAAPADRMASET